MASYPIKQFQVNLKVLMSLTDWIWNQSISYASYMYVGALILEEDQIRELLNLSISNYGFN